MSVNDLNYQCRTHILSFTQLKFHRAVDYMLLFYFNRRTKRYDFKNVGTGDDPIKEEKGVIFRRLYGYYKDDVTRTIFFVPGRIKISFNFSGDENDDGDYTYNPLTASVTTIKLEDYIPFGTKYVFVDIQERFTKVFKFDYTNVSASNIIIENHCDHNMAIESYATSDSRKRLQNDYKSSLGCFSCYSIFGPVVPLRIDSFKRIMYLSKIVMLEIQKFDEEYEVKIKDDDNIFKDNQSYERDPCCSSLFLLAHRDLRNGSSFIPFPDTSTIFYESMRNLLKLRIQHFNFRTITEMSNFFTLIRKYLPSLRFLSLLENKIIINGVVVPENYDVHPFQVLLHENESLNELELDLPSTGSLYSLPIEKIHNTKLSKVFFQITGPPPTDINDNKLFQLLTKLFCKNQQSSSKEEKEDIYHQNLTSFGISCYFEEENSSVLRREISKIIKKLSPKITEIQLLLPHIIFDEEYLHEALLSRINTLKKLVLTTDDMCSILGLIFMYKGLEELVLNSLKCDWQRSMMMMVYMTNESQKEYKIKKKNLKKLENNLGPTLKRFQFNGICKPFIYFIKYSSKFSQILFASNKTYNSGDHLIFDYKKSCVFEKPILHHHPNITKNNQKKFIKKKLEMMIFRRKFQIYESSSKTDSLDYYYYHDDGKIIEKINLSEQLGTNKEQQQNEYREKSIKRWELIETEYNKSKQQEFNLLVDWKKYYEDRIHLETKSISEIIFDDLGKTTEEEYKKLIDSIKSNFEKKIKKIFLKKKKKTGIEQEDEQFKNLILKSYYLKKIEKDYNSIVLTMKFYSFEDDGQSYEVWYNVSKRDRSTFNEFRESGGVLQSSFFSRSLLENSNFVDFKIISVEKLWFFTFCFFGSKFFFWFNNNNDLDDILSFFYVLFGGGVRDIFIEKDFEFLEIDNSWMIREARRVYGLDYNQEEEEEEVERNEINRCCFVCNIIPKKLKCCARCNNVFYCGRECQLKHWKEEHKKVCKKKKKKKKIQRKKKDFVDYIIDEEIGIKNHGNDNLW